MRIAQKIGYMAVTLLVFGAINFTPAEAAYKPKTNTSKMNGQTRKELKDAVTFLKALPKSERWAFIAERLGLLFMPKNGKPGHRDNSWVRIDGAHFIGCDGKEYDALSEISHGLRTSDWPKKTGIIDRIGREEVFSQLASEVRALVLANAKYQLNKMAEEHKELRDLYLAHLAKLCYFTDTREYYEESTWNGPHQLPVRSYILAGGRFIDLNGEEHDVDRVYKLNSALGGDRWTTLNVCTHHVGKKDILDLFTDDVKKLRANYKKKMQEFHNNITEQADSEEDKNISEPKQPTTVTDAIKAMKQFSPLLRSAIIAEKMGLLFNTDGKPSYESTLTTDEEDHTRYYKVNSGAQFFDENGVMHSFEDVINKEVLFKKGMPEKWRQMKQTIYNHGEEAVFKPFANDLEKIVISTAKYHLDELNVEVREAWLAFVADLVYTKNGSSPYAESAPHKWTQPGTLNLRQQNEWRNVSPNARYINSHGNETLKLWSRGSKDQRLADMANWCRVLVGSEKILDLYPETLKVMRAFYQKRSPK